VHVVVVVVAAAVPGNILPASVAKKGRAPLREAAEEKDPFPTDRPVVVRDNALENLRASEKWLQHRDAARLVDIVIGLFVCFVLEAVPCRAVPCRAVCIVCCWIRFSIVFALSSMRYRMARDDKTMK